MSARFSIFKPRAFAPGNDLPYALYLPLAAVAWYHQRVGQQQSLLDTVNAARDFALGEYAAALMRGTLLSQDEEAAIAAKIADDWPAGRRCCALQLRRRSHHLCERAAAGGRQSGRAARRALHRL
ncbi:MAG: hypothetical protein R2911_36305 [Caldilineaceae bacterium]